MSRRIREAPRQAPEAAMGRAAAPPVAIALFAHLLPLLVGPEAAARMSPLRDRQGGIGSKRLTIVDNGRLAGGALECPVDGEGMPCGEAVLIEEGVFRQPLLAWWQVNGAAPGAASGCCHRPSWRDLPAPGPTASLRAPRSPSLRRKLAGLLRRQAPLASRHRHHWK